MSVNSSSGAEFVCKSTGRTYKVWKYGTSHMTARRLPLVPGDRGWTLTNEQFAKEFQAAS